MKIKKVSAIFLSVALATGTAAAPMNLVPAAAAEARALAECKTYLDAERTFDGSTNEATGRQKVTEGLEFFKGMKSGNFTASFKTTSTALQSLIVLNSNSSADHYVSLYISGGNKIGIEIRDAGNNHQTVTVDKNLADGQKHTVTFQVEENVGYKFYLDGELVKNTAASSTTFVADLPWAADNMTSLSFGGADRIGGKNNYLFTGSIQNVKIYQDALTEEEILEDHREKEREDIAYQTENLYFGADASYETITGDTLAAFKAMDQGTITLRYRAKSADSGEMSLFSVSDSTSEKYLTVSVDPSANKIGLRIVGASGVAGDYRPNLSAGTSVRDTKWHTVTVVKYKDVNSNRFYIYLDGTELGYYSNRTAFINAINTADSAAIGFMNASSQYKFTGAIDKAEILSTALTADEIKEEHHKIAFESKTVENPEGLKTVPERLYYGGFDGSIGYRIPSLLTTKEGTVIAGIDKRQSGMADQGNIDMAVRRKENAANPDSKFGEPIIVLDMNNTPGGKPSFLIDSCLVEDKEKGRVYMVMDMFPESAGLMESALIHEGTGHEKIGEEYYKVLYTDGTNPTEENKFGTIREDGIVYDKEGNATDYRVITECLAPYQELGNLYKNGEYKGNIYRYSSEDKGELSVMRTQYLWITHSDDDGKTWSVPQDITPQVKQDWMLFLGTGPGVGIKMQNGKLAVPVYSAGRDVSGTQSSAIIVSEDGNGEKWTLRESPNPNHNMNSDRAILTESQLIQTPNGDLHLFMRNTGGKVKESISSDEGKTWSAPTPIAEIADVYCQLTVTTYKKGNEMYVILANPTGDSKAYVPRNSGKVYIGKVGGDGTTIQWLNNKFINHQRYGYSCLTVIDADGATENANPKFGLFYEDETTGPDMFYTEFDEAWVKSGTIQTTQGELKAVDKEVNLKGNTLEINLTFDQIVMAAGAPKLNLTVGSKTFTADYVSGSGTKKVTFTATLPDGAAGVVKAAGVDETAGYFESTINGKASLDETLYDLTKLTLTDSMLTVSSTGEGSKAALVDGNPATYWHSDYRTTGVKLPQSVIIDLGAEKEIYRLGYVARNGNGQVKDYQVLGSTDGVIYTELTEGTMRTGTQETQYAEFSPAAVRYVKFVANTAANAEADSVNKYCAIAELELYEYAEGVSLAENGDKSALQNIVDSINAMDYSKYSKASCDAVDVIKEKAEALLNSVGIVTQNKLDDAYDALVRAKREFVSLSPADQAKAEYQDLKEADYTEESWAAFTAGMEGFDVDERLNTALKDKQVTDVVMKLNYEMSKLKQAMDDGKSAYTVTAKYEDGTEILTEKHVYNDAVVVKAQAEKDGAVFAGWKLNGEFVSFSPEYKCYVSGNMEFTAVYGEAEKKAQALLSNIIVTDRAGEQKSDVKFVGQLVIPEGYRLVNAGLIWSTKDTTVLELGMGLNPTYITAISNTNQFSVTIKGLPYGMSLRGRTFAVIEKDGKQETVYSDEKKITPNK